MAENNICEQVTNHWEEHDRILPTVYQLSEGKIAELIDGIDDKLVELKRALREAKELAAL